MTEDDLKLGEFGLSRPYVPPPPPPLLLLAASDLLVLSMTAEVGKDLEWKGGEGEADRGRCGEILLGVGDVGREGERVRVGMEIGLDVAAVVEGLLV